MTVKELIEYLQKIPPDYEVEIVKTYADERDEWKTIDQREELYDYDILTINTDKKVILWEAV